MYFLDLVDERIDAFKQGWGEIGDSIVVVGGDGLWNCHVHTNDIGAAIEAALKLDGRPKQIRVTDLFEEMAEEHAAREAALHGASAHGASVQGAPRRLGPLRAGWASGRHVRGGRRRQRRRPRRVFGQLGVQGVVTGGQTPTRRQPRAARCGRSGQC